MGRKKKIDKKTKIESVATEFLKELIEFREWCVKRVDKIERKLLNEIFRELVKLREILYTELDKDTEYIEMRSDQLVGTTTEILKTFSNVWKQGKRIRIIDLESKLALLQSKK